MRTMLRWIALLMLCLLVGSAYAQEAEAQEAERGPLWEVTTLEVAPGDIGAFHEVVQEVVSAAGMANMGSEYGWYFWSNDNNYVVSNQVESMAQFDDPEAWMRQFAENEEAQKKVQAAFQRMEAEVQVREVSRDILEVATDWVYEPENAPETGGGMLYTFRVKPGEYEAFKAVSDEFNAFWGEIGYPYNVYAYWPRMGELGVMYFLIPYDSRSNYYGENSLEAVAERAGHGEMHRELVSRLMQTLEDWETQDMEFHGDLSYTGPPAGSN